MQGLVPSGTSPFSILRPRSICRIDRQGQPCCDAQSSQVEVGFTMPRGLRECELAMTIILTFYDNSDVCRIF
jgi:hypothetical protein